MGKGERGYIFRIVNTQKSPFLKKNSKKINFGTENACELNNYITIQLYWSPNLVFMRVTSYRNRKK